MQSIAPYPLYKALIKSQIVTVHSIFRCWDIIFHATCFPGVSWKPLDLVFQIHGNVLTSSIKDNCQSMVDSSMLTSRLSFPPTSREGHTCCFQILSTQRSPSEDGSSDSLSCIMYWLSMKAPLVSSVLLVAIFEMDLPILPSDWLDILPSRECQEKFKSSSTFSADRSHEKGQNFSLTSE